MGHEWPESPLILEATTVAPDDFTWLNKKKVKASTLRTYFADTNTQTVTTSPATVAAKFVVLDDDGHTSGLPGSLVMPPITEGAWHVINTPYEDVHFVISQDPGDPVNTGPDYQVNSQFVRQQMIFIFAAESEGQLRWQYDSTAEYLSSSFVYLFQLAAQILALERPYADARTHTETGAAYTWSSGLDIKRVVINRSGTKHTLTLDESDWEDGTTGRLDILDSDGLGIEIVVGGSAVLNGQAAGVGYETLTGSDLVGGMPPSYEVTRIDGGWTIRAMVDVAAVGIGAQVIGGSSGEIKGALDVYLTSSDPAIAVLLPDATAGRRVRLHKDNDLLTQTISLVRSAGDSASGATINGVAAPYDYDIVLTSIEGPRRSWDICAPTPLAWHVSDGETVALAQLADDLDYEVGEIGIRLAALEAPTSVDENAAAVSWTTQARIRNIHALALAVFTTNATTGQWPIGQSRLLANFSTAAFGVRVNVPSGHYLNGILNGNTGTLGAAAAVAGSPIYSLLVTREDTDRWSWS